jgi:uncharacterized membrane protein
MTLSKIARINFPALIVTAIILTVFGSCTKEVSEQPHAELYYPKVKLIVQSNCISCHGSTGNFLGRPVAFDNDSEIVAFASAIKSSVADPVSITNKRMPVGDELSAAGKNMILQWYYKGGRSTD